MTNRHWRELLEIVGVVAIVASLILVASQLRQGNRIAAAQTELKISENLHVLNHARATDAEFAKLFAKLEDPEAHLITATDASQIQGIARQLVSVQWTVHRAHKNGLINRAVRDSYTAEFAHFLEDWPGIRPDLVDMYQKHEWMRNNAVFQPIESYLPSGAADAPGSASE